MKAAIYIRISSAELQADGYSLEAQEIACRRLAENRGWEVVEVFTDKKSARTTERLAFKSMLWYARAGRFDVLIVHKLDRFSRSVVDQLNAFDALTKAGVGFVSATEGRFDFSTPAGRLQMTVLGAVNEWYLNNLSTEVSKGLKARAESGMWLGEVPFGYDCDYKKDGGNGQAYPNEHEAEAVRLAFEKYATGRYSYRDVAQALNEAGYRPRGRGDRALRLFSKDTVNVMLTNRFYIGEVEYKGEHFTGLHEPIISDALFNQVQEARKARYHGRGVSARKSSFIYPLTGVARCARCFTPMRGTNSEGYRYYRDPARDQGFECDQRLIGALEAENALGDFLGRVTLPPDWEREAITLLEGRANQWEDTTETKAQVENQLERLKRLFILGDISESKYRVERDRLQAKLAAMRPPRMPDLKQAVGLLQDFKGIWVEAIPKERKQIVHALFEAVYLDADEGPVVAVEPKAEFASLFEVAHGIVLPGELEPRRPRWLHNNLYPG